MVLRQLFEELLARGTVVAFTSNQPPDALYQVRSPHHVKVANRTIRDSGGR
jgi:predicted ATPase